MNSHLFLMGYFTGAHVADKSLSSLCEGAGQIIVRDLEKHWGVYMFLFNFAKETKITLQMKIKTKSLRKSC